MHFYGSETKEIHIQNVNKGNTHTKCKQKRFLSFIPNTFCIIFCENIRLCLEDLDLIFKTNLTIHLLVIQLETFHIFKDNWLYSLCVTCRYHEGKGKEIMYEMLEI